MFNENFAKQDVTLPGVYIFSTKFCLGFFLADLEKIYEIKILLCIKTKKDEKILPFDIQLLIFQQNTSPSPLNFP